MHRKHSVARHRATTSAHARSGAGLRGELQGEARGAPWAPHGNLLRAKLLTSALGRNAVLIPPMPAARALFNHTPIIARETRAALQVQQPHRLQTTQAASLVRTSMSIVVLDANKHQVYAHMVAAREHACGTAESLEQPVPVVAFGTPRGVHVRESRLRQLAWLHANPNK